MSLTAEHGTLAASSTATHASVVRVAKICDRAAITGSREFALFFLACVVVAGLYGAYSVNKRIFLVQALPALLALAAVCCL